jgi:hypothetical protein
MHRKLIFYLGIIFLLKLTACDNSTLKKPDNTLSKHNQIIGVSVWDKISTRSEPRRKSSSTTLLSLGESFVYLDSFAIDSAYNNTKFLKARLSDSSIVWVYGFASELNASPAVITKEVPLYMRPDLQTITEKRINTMEIVAVVEEWDNWIKVVNEKKEKKGWIKKEYITNNTIDLAFALLAKRKLEEQNPEQKIKNLEDLLENNPYPNSIFIPELRTILDIEKEILRDSQDNRDWEDKNRRKSN